jgi:hypothetical protein
MGGAGMRKEGPFAWFPRANAPCLVVGNDEQGEPSFQQARNTSGPSPTMSGCRASDTAGDIRITSA